MKRSKADAVQVHEKNPRPYEKLGHEHTLKEPVTGLTCHSTEAASVVQRHTFIDSADICLTISFNAMASRLLPFDMTTSTA